ncbi:MAG: hypothetical protein AMS15_02395 [Planctomycetes bacterium DG_23]|nr:MAG: hypothetical protein AMS15_02395 [Planctomycetes bacterium DG_23]
MKTKGAFLALFVSNLLLASLTGCASAEYLRAYGRYVGMGGDAGEVAYQALGGKARCNLAGRFLKGGAYGGGYGAAGLTSPITVNLHFLLHDTFPEATVALQTTAGVVNGAGAGFVGLLAAPVGVLVEFVTWAPQTSSFQFSSDIEKVDFLIERIEFLSKWDYELLKKLTGEDLGDVSTEKGIFGYGPAPPEEICNRWRNWWSENRALYEKRLGASNESS